MQMPQAINQVLARKDLNGEEMSSVMRAIMTGGATAAQIGGFLIGLHMKGETVTEIAAAAAVMRELASGVQISDLDYTVDIVGTGGDASGTFNISTASMFVAAAAGCHVAKHGNRSVSSKSSTADAIGGCRHSTPVNPETSGTMCTKSRCWFYVCTRPSCRHETCYRTAKRDGGPHCI